MNATALNTFFKTRNSKPVLKNQAESDGIMQQLEDSDFKTAARLHAFVIFKDRVFSLYAFHEKYILIKQFNIDKLAAGYEDSLRTGWKDSNGNTLSWSKLQQGKDLEGAYRIFNSKQWVDLPGNTYELDAKFLPDEVKIAKTTLLSAGNYLTGIDGKIAIINDKKYKLTLV